jgi:uncharacterized protein YjbI with pentapeptide repeats
LANPEQIARLRKEQVEDWNRWRRQNPEVPDLSGAFLYRAELHGIDLSRANLGKADLRADLSGANLGGANLHEANLRGANLGRAYLNEADLSQSELQGANLTEAGLTGTNLSDADLRGARIRTADLRGANLTRANLSEADLWGAKFRGAKLAEANVSWADLYKADFREANLRGANLHGANLIEADLSGADLSGANLTEAVLVNTNLAAATLTACSVFGISAWKVRLEGAIQSNLVITDLGESPIQVDNLEVAQFIYLLLNNEKIRGVIDTITSKVVLILGRFTAERKVVLDAIRDELRKRDYLPVLFDFEKPASKDLTGTISTLANMARFIIADLTDPSSVPHELATVVPGTVVPVQAIILEGQREYAMFPDLMTRYHWVLEPVQYKSQELLIGQLGERVIAPAEAKAKELARK